MECWEFETFELWVLLNLGVWQSWNSETVKQWNLKTLKLWNFYFHLRESPHPQHSDSHPCASCPPGGHEGPWGTRVDGTHRFTYHFSIIIVKLIWFFLVWGCAGSHVIIISSRGVRAAQVPLWLVPSFHMWIVTCWTAVLSRTLRATPPPRLGSSIVVLARPSGVQLRNFPMQQRGEL